MARWESSEISQLNTNQILEKMLVADSIEEIYELLGYISKRKRISRTDLLTPMVDRVLELARGSSSSPIPSTTPPGGGPPNRPIYWPTTLIIPSGLDGNPIDDSVIFRDFSALYVVGYQVGKTRGLSRGNRQNILSTFMISHLHPRIEEIFGDEYGEPKSMKRLMKVANLLASLCRNMKRKLTGDYSFAIRHYEEDLEFLRIKFFEPMILRGYWLEHWPDTEV